jgi:hypothetical protein
MKINCKPRRQDRHKESNAYLSGRLWKQSLPFNVNPRGVLLHRVRIGVTYFRRGERSHDAVTYWCGNSAVGEGVSLTDAPPTDRLLCVNCERIAVEAGEPTAEALTGRHVCTGVMKAFRLCCRNEEN